VNNRVKTTKTAIGNDDESNMSNKLDIAFSDWQEQVIIPDMDSAQDGFDFIKNDIYPFAMKTKVYLNWILGRVFKDIYPYYDTASEWVKDIKINLDYSKSSVHLFVKMAESYATRQEVGKFRSMTEIMADIYPNPDDSRHNHKDEEMKPSKKGKEKDNLKEATRIPNRFSKIISAIDILRKDIEAADIPEDFRIVANAALRKTQEDIEEARMKLDELDTTIQEKVVGKTSNKEAA